MDANGPDRSPAHLLQRVAQCIAELFQAEMLDGDLRSRELAVLKAVAQHEGLSQTDLAERFGIHRSKITHIVRRLKGKGLLQRRRAKKDTRTYAVKLTDKARRVLRPGEPPAKRVDDRVLRALPVNQRERFLGELRSIVDTLESMPSPSR